MSELPDVEKKIRQKHNSLIVFIQTRVNDMPFHFQCLVTCKMLTAADSSDPPLRFDTCNSSFMTFITCEENIRRLEYFVRLVK